MIGPMNTDNLIAIGYDGTAINTEKNGSEAYIIKRTSIVLWFVLFLHGSELPKPHLLKTVSRPVGSC